MATRKRAGAPFEIVLGSKLDVVALGKWLRDVRETVGTTQFALAEKLESPYQNLSRLETGRGKREPMLSTMSRYLRALDWELVLTARPRKAKGGAGEGGE